MTVEKLLNRLNDIALKMDGNISIDESVKLFEEGVSIAEEINKMLSEYSGKVTYIKDKLNHIEEKYDIE